MHRVDVLMAKKTSQLLRNVTLQREVYVTDYYVTLKRISIRCMWRSFFTCYCNKISIKQEVLNMQNVYTFAFIIHHTKLHPNLKF